MPSSRNDDIEKNDLDNHNNTKEENRSSNVQNSKLFRVRKGYLQKFFFWICGIEKSVENNSSNTKNLSNKEITNLSPKEDPFWSKFNNLNLIFQLCLSAFMWVFFNQYR